MEGKSSGVFLLLGIEGLMIKINGSNVVVWKIKRQRHGDEKGMIILSFCSKL